MFIPRQQEKSTELVFFDKSLETVLTYIKTNEINTQKGVVVKVFLTNNFMDRENSAKLVNKFIKAGFEHASANVSGFTLKREFFQHAQEYYADFLAENKD
jgi:hypothetical protein